MDFDIPQEKETRFLYVLPIKTNYALVDIPFSKIFWKMSLMKRNKIIS